MLIRYGMNSGDNLEKIESSVELMEARLAKNMVLFLNAGKYSIGKIQNDLEWFVTWRIKLVDLKNRMWCDGIDELRISKIGHNVVRVKAVASIGPESDVSLIYKCNLDGELVLNQKLSSFNSYDLVVCANNITYKMQKST